MNSHSITRLLLDEREDWGELLGANLIFTGLWVALLSTALWWSSSWLSERFALPEGRLIYSDCGHLSSLGATHPVRRRRARFAEALEVEVR